MVAIGILLLVVFGFPLCAMISGRPSWQAEFFWFSPDATAAVTLAFLSINRGPSGLGVMLVIALWAVASALILYTLGRWDCFVVSLAAATSIGLWVLGCLRFKRGKRLR